jgi:hypothetical protein
MNAILLITLGKNPTGTHDTVERNDNETLTNRRFHPARLAYPDVLCLHILTFPIPEHSSAATLLTAVH